MNNEREREPIIYYGDGESGQREWVRKRKAELRPEPTAGDTEEAEDLAIAFVDLCEKENCRLHRIDTIAPAIEAALSAARGDRAELEAELKKWHEIGRRAKRNLDAPFTAENPVQILVDAAALAAILEVGA